MLKYPIAYGTDEECLEYFTESRLAAAIEHNLVAPDSASIASRRDEIRRAGEDLSRIAKLAIDLGPGLSITPDHWNVLANRVPRSCDQ